jgi:hypothetical protein
VLAFCGYAVGAVAYSVVESSRRLHFMQRTISCHGSTRKMTTDNPEDRFPLYLCVTFRPSAVDRKCKKHALPPHSIFSPGGELVDWLYESLRSPSAQKTAV